MITVTALTSGVHVPSSRFRVRQFIQPLSRYGIHVTEHPSIIRKYTPRSFAPLRYFADAFKTAARAPGLLASRASDITWLERELVPERSFLERFAGSRQLFDVDDAIWLNNDSNFSEEIASRSAGVIAGNSFIAEHFQNIAPRVWVVPTSIDTDVWQPLARRVAEPWVIGWIGTSSNLPFLEALDEPLANFLAQFPAAKLHVVCDRKPSFKRLPPTSWNFAVWSAESEVREVQRMDVGLMPLPDTEWARGKCAFKMLSYLACGIPVVASPVGVNQELFQQADVGLPATSNEDWFEALRVLFEDRRRAHALGTAGRQLVEARYSVKRNVELLANIFHDVAN